MAERYPRADCGWTQNEDITASVVYLFCHDGSILTLRTGPCGADRATRRLLRKVEVCLEGVLFYALIVLLTIWIMDTMTGTWRTMFIAFLGLFYKVYPCGMLSGIVISTTKVSEFLSAMNRIHAPQKLVIPLAVMLRYIPTIQEDWRFIKDAMRMRDVSPSLKGFLTHPGITVECIYVPLMMAASKAADELSIASITRGIENPSLELVWCRSISG